MLYWPASQKWRLTSCNECWMTPLVWSAVDTTQVRPRRVATLTHRTTLAQCTGACRVEARSHGVQLSAQLTQYISSTSASLSPVSPLDNIFALPAEIFSSCLAIVSAVMVGDSAGVFCCRPCDMELVTTYQTVWDWEIRPSAETPSSVQRRRFYFQLTRVHSALELSGRCALQIYLLSHLLNF